MYAEIAVNIALGPWTSSQGAPPPSYHYRVPADLMATITVGQLVRVPFGARPAQGVVLSLSDQRPDLPAGTTIRAIETIADPAPVLSEPLLTLAHWIAETTLSPLSETVWSMLPPGLEEKAHQMVELTDDGRWTIDDGRSTEDDNPQSSAVNRPSSIVSGQSSAVHRPSSRLGPVQQAILDALKKHGPTRLDELAERAGIQSTTSLASLIERGLVQKRWQLEPPSVRPRTVRIAVLTATAEQVQAAAPRLGRDTPEATALAWLAQSDDPLPTVAALRTATGVAMPTLRRLSEAGLIGLTEGHTLVALRISRADAAQRLTHQNSEASDQRSERLGKAGEALLRRLVDSPVPLTLADLRGQGVSSSTIAKLVTQELAQKIEEEATVYLTIPPEDVPDTLLKLRQAETHHRVLKRLLAVGPEMDAAELTRATETSLDNLRALEGLGLLRLEERVAWRDPLAGQSFVAVDPPRLTDDQAQVWTTIHRAFDHPAQSLPFLLHGVTGSGKTEIYLRAVEAALARGRQALILVPEIALTPQTVRRFAARFAGRVSVWHSKLTPGQRYDTWRRIRNGEIAVIVGSRSALFTPLWKLGLIVVDEEHEPSYKQDQTPRYHARDAALRLAALTQSVAVLGSATPDIETYARAERGDLTLLRLPRRVLGHRQAVAEQQARLGLSHTPAMRPIADLDALYADLPPVQIVDLRAELRAGNTSLFSRALQNALAETLQRQQQAILFLNRRGAATFVMCRDCGHVLECPRCSSSLTYHQTSGALVCHHCGHRQTPPRVCPKCGSERIKHFGAGTQRVEETLLALYPQARVIRWDRDTTGGKTAHSDYLDAFIQGDADVLVGTQMIAKGLDLPLVTLVGVVSADTGLHLPDFRAAERSFQLLTQVAGRAARSPLGGRVIFQTYTPDHYAIQTAARHDYEAFYAAEMEFRRSAVYPPYSRLARLIYTDPTWDRARVESETLARKLTDYIRRQGFANTSLIGPAPAFFGRERGEYRWHIILRSVDPARILRDYLAQDRPPYGWRIDMNPVSLL